MPPIIIKHIVVRALISFGIGGKIISVGVHVLSMLYAVWTVYFGTVWIFCNSKTTTSTIQVSRQIKLCFGFLRWIQNNLMFRGNFLLTTNRIWISKCGYFPQM